MEKGFSDNWDVLKQSNWGGNSNKTMKIIKQSGRVMWNMPNISCWSITFTQTCSVHRCNALCLFSSEEQENERQRRKGIDQLVLFQLSHQSIHYFFHQRVSASEDEPVQFVLEPSGQEVQSTYTVPILWHKSWNNSGCRDLVSSAASWGSLPGYRLGLQCERQTKLGLKLLLRIDSFEWEDFSLMWCFLTESGSDEPPVGVSSVVETTKLLGDLDCLRGKIPVPFKSTAPTRCLEHVSIATAFHILLGSTKKAGGWTFQLQSKIPELPGQRPSGLWCQAS